MRHRPAEGADEQDAADVGPAGELQHAVAELPPAEVRLLADEEEKVGRRATVERVGRHVEGGDQAVLDLDVRAEQGGQLHRAGEVADVERLRVDVGDGPGAEQVHEAADGAGGDVAAVHPAGEGEDQGGPVERGNVMGAEGVGSRGGHGGIIPLTTGIAQRPGLLAA